MLKWKTSSLLKVIGSLFLAWKISLSVQKLLRTEETIAPISVEKGLGRVLNEDGTFSIMNRVRLRFILRK